MKADARFNDDKTEARLLIGRYSFRVNREFWMRLEILARRVVRTIDEHSP